MHRSKFAFFNANLLATLVKFFSFLPLVCVGEGGRITVLRAPRRAHLRGGAAIHVACYGCAPVVALCSCIVACL